MKENANEILERILKTIQNQKDERVYDITWVGRNYSKGNLIKDLKEMKKLLS